ncbi:unnamed protein product (macronuclear) [Paramecium tetraurelia]|uniref:Uncharacterized protein n=1 Tax=Paramecium tetraurelia TaxID=5888 RepID=A0EGB1_PARTE|nr:uncharacterized protein GSPATT00026676001 [Paramecium tetraurelia]CAK94352.1 unnamed protein product [Paramecium tetraurelia]|eukprot:XP_001461725.1 hypothetical protein (macronuclear) [Paramecium tetraurelia strain d4-2]
MNTIYIDTKFLYSMVPYSFEWQNQIIKKIKKLVKMKLTQKSAFLLINSRMIVKEAIIKKWRYRIAKNNEINTNQLKQSSISCQLIIMQGLLQPSQQTLLVRSPTEGSMQSYSRYESKGKKRIVYKNNKGEIIDPHDKLAKSQHSRPSQPTHSVKSRTTTPTPSDSVKTQNTSILDLVPIDDPIWLELIPTEIQQDPNFNLERLIMDNQEYFVNLLGLYMQERQQNRIQEIKVSLPQKKQTTYDQVYKKPNAIDHSNFNIKMYDQLPMAQSLQLQTQYETSFRTPKITPQDNFKPSYIKDNAEMLTLTSYKQNYVNWKTCHTERMGPQRGQSTGTLPFIGKTSYQENYRANNWEPTESAKKKSLGPFASGSSMIFKEALSKIHYPNYQIEEAPPRQENSNHHQGNRSYDGQFKTTFKNSFVYKVPEPILQDRYWKQKLIQKILEKKQN